MPDSNQADSPTLQDLLDRAKALVSEGGIDKAVAVLDEALTLVRAEDNALDTGHVLFLKAQLCAALKDPVAVEHAREAEDVLRVVLPENHPMLDQVRRFLAMLGGGEGAGASNQGGPQDLIEQLSAVLSGARRVRLQRLVRMAQRVVMYQAVGDWPTTLALLADKPGAELDAPGSLQPPSGMDKEKAAQMRSMLASIPDMMTKVDSSVRPLLEPRVDSDGFVSIPGDVAADNLAPQVMQAVFHEAGAILMDGDAATVKQELDLLVVGAGVQLSTGDENDNADMALRLLSLAPYESKRIRKALQPLCSEGQWAMIAEAHEV